MLLVFLRLLMMVLFWHMINNLQFLLPSQVQFFLFWVLQQNFWLKPQPHPSFLGWLILQLVMVSRSHSLLRIYLWLHQAWLYIVRVVHSPLAPLIRQCHGPCTLMFSKKMILNIDIDGLYQMMAPLLLIALVQT